MSEAPERIWAQDAEPAECHYIGGGWWDDECGSTQYPHMVEYTPKALSDAAIAGAYEAAAVSVEPRGEEPSVDPSNPGDIAEHASWATAGYNARAILALTPADALAARDAHTARAVEALEAQLAEAVEALEDVVNPLRYLQRAAEADGCQLSGRAYEVANSVHTARDIARAALAKIKGAEG